jgi:formate hydrogenlyase transcriptional activator
MMSPDDHGGTSKQELRDEPADLTITDAIPIGILVLAPDGRTLYMNRLALDHVGLTLDDVRGKGHLERTCHPDDLDRVLEERRKGLSKGVPFELEIPLLLKNGERRWHLAQYNPLVDERGHVVRWYVTVTDIDDRKRAEEKLRKSEEDLRTVSDTIRQSIVVLTPDGTTLYANRVALDHIGLTPGEVNDQGFFARAFHPDDVDRVRDERDQRLKRGDPFELEMRSLMKDGNHRWQLVQYNPLKSEAGKIIRWYATATDIDDRKKTEERLRNENLALREEIDRSSMFEEIVGSCKPMRQLLKQVEKAAPSDSTVLILGETGTGKELIARALHRRSKRANRAFVRSVSECHCPR